MAETLMHCAAKSTTEPSILAPAAKKPRVESTHLFQGNNEIVIVHQKEEYNLRITKNGKLILTK